MAGNSKRTIIHLESTAGTGYRCTVTKSKRVNLDPFKWSKSLIAINEHNKKGIYMTPNTV